MGTLKGISVVLSDDGNSEPNVTYSDDAPLTPDELASVMVPLLRDTLGPEPQLTDLLALQAAMGKAMKGE